MPEIKWSKLIITILRVAIGWHFLFEGVSKLLADNWSAYSYLANAYGFLQGFYHWMASSEGMMKVIDILNVYGLILIGLALFSGLFIRFAAVGGVLLLTLYYFASPPFGSSLFSGNEGSLYIVNKNFIEAMALLFFIFSHERGYGLDALFVLVNKNKPSKEYDEEINEYAPVNSRREALKNLAAIPFLGVMGLGAHNMQRKYGVDVMSGATIQLSSGALTDIKGSLPMGKLKDHTISRLVMGGNLIGGYSHSRDLIYVNSLFKAYNTEKKVYETLMLAENAGINVISSGMGSLTLLEKYKKLTGSKIKVIAQAGTSKEGANIYEMYDKAIDSGVDIIQLAGNWCDWLVRDQKLDVIEKLLAYARRQGYVAGLGAHTIDSLIICEEEGIIPDYYMKTMHHDNYWSAHPRENRKPFEVDGKKSPDHNMFHDNCFCPFPDKTVEFVNRVKVPVMGFKVLAAGAIKPNDGFRWAFENGADFICVGMFDFQIVNDVNIAIDVINNLPNRKRQWFG